MATMSNDELLEILSWLPAKAVHKHRSTSKLFSELPETPYFVAKQAENSLKKNRPSCFFIQRDDILNHNEHVELHPLPGEELSSGVPENMLGFIARSRLKILSSSNGLLLCLHGIELFIINPATCSLLDIPLPNHLQQRRNLPSVSMTLECDSDDYRLILFDNEEWSLHFDCHVYSHKQGAWSLRKNRFFAGSRNLKFDKPVICNGAIHFISDCYRYLTEDSTYFRPYIMSYEIKNGDDEDESIETKFLRVPKEARRGSHDNSCHMNIFKWGEVAGYQTICLVRLRKRVFTVWILTNYESSSWRRIMKVRVKGMGLVEHNPVIRGFTVLNGDLVFATEKKVYTYGLTSEKYMVLSEICDHGCESRFVCFVPYSDTLRPCGIGAKSLRPYLQLRKHDQAEKVRIRPVK
ncbi:F-box/kelch-repeat protein At3g06240-like [Arachis hypogaea]|uniref:F-box/kelch-repeat protein At3g06240-like n=1 Tax=Arachis hypogaea TaxID=3818 RepID=UPI000DECEADB